MILYNAWPFSDPTPVWLWNPLAAAGIYAIQVMDAEWSPRPVYFGKTEEFSGCRSVSAHHAFRSWTRVAGGEFKLWVSFHREPYAMRRTVKEIALIQAYTPVCNVRVPEPIPPTTV